MNCVHRAQWYKTKSQRKIRCHFQKASFIWQNQMPLPYPPFPLHYRGEERVLASANQSRTGVEHLILYHL